MRRLANEAKSIMAADPDAMMIKDDWRRPVPVVQPIYSENKGERVGISRKDVADASADKFLRTTELAFSARGKISFR